MEWIQIGSRRGCRTPANCLLLSFLQWAKFQLNAIESFLFISVVNFFFFLSFSALIFGLNYSDDWVWSIQWTSGKWKHKLYCTKSLQKKIAQTRGTHKSYGLIDSLSWMKGEVKVLQKGREKEDLRNLEGDVVTLHDHTNGFGCFEK
jgi:hypothetical protein